MNPQSSAEPCPAAAPGDAALLDALRRGQASAYEELMRRHNRLLFRVARGIVPDDAEAQDVVQETWLRAFTGIASFRGDAALSTWLTRIAIHQALGHQRKLGRLVYWDADADDEDSDMTSLPPPGATRAVAESSEARAAREQMLQRLLLAVDALPPIYRSVFVLRAVEGASVEDTALALRVSRDVVKTRFLRARAQLRERLGPDIDAHATDLHDFAGSRCDAVVSGVLAALRAEGAIRDH